MAHPLPVSAAVLTLVATLLSVSALRVGTALATGGVGVLRTSRDGRAIGVQFSRRSRKGGVLPIVEAFCAVVVSRSLLKWAGAVFGLWTLLSVALSVLLFDAAVASFTWFARKQVSASPLAASEPQDGPGAMFARLLAQVTAWRLFAHALGIVLGWLVVRPP